MLKDYLRVLLLNFIFMSTLTSAFSQSLSGTLMDRKTNESIPFATVQIGSNYGVVSNSEGNFQIEISDFTAKDSLHFSSMGYQNKVIAIGDYDREKVYLKKRTEKLTPVFLQNKKLTPRQIMDSVKNRLKSNYDIKLTAFSLFRRDKMILTPKQTEFKVKKARNLVGKKTVKKFNRTFDSLSKASRDNTSTAYSSILSDAVINEDSAKLHLNKATKLVNYQKKVSARDFVLDIFDKLSNNLETDNTFKVRSGILPVKDSVDVTKGFKKDNDTLKASAVKNEMTQKIGTDIFYKRNSSGTSFEISSGTNIPSVFVKNLDDYEYKLESIEMLNDHFVYAISFKPQHNFFGSNKGKYVGTLYISTDDFAIVKENFSLAEGEEGEKFNMKFLLGIKYVERKKSGVVIFQKTENSRYFPKYVRLSGQRYIYFNRNFVLKENTDDRENRIKLKFRFKFEFDNAYQDEWLFSDLKAISKEDYKIFSENKAIREQQMQHFDPEMWKKENIIAPTKAVEDYDGDE